MPGPPACLANSLVRRGRTIQSGKTDGGREKNRIGRARCLLKDGDRDKEGGGWCEVVGGWWCNDYFPHSAITAPPCVNQGQKSEVRSLAAIQATQKKSKEWAMTQISCCEKSVLLLYCRL